MIIAWGLFIFSVIYVCILLSVFISEMIRKININKDDAIKFERHIWLYSIVGLCSAQYIWG